jgi:hypothetical protein
MKFFATLLLVVAALAVASAVPVTEELAERDIMSIIMDLLRGFLCGGDDGGDDGGYFL